jgi:hypothetical protein
MHPAWGRAFEPPAVASNETRSALEALLDAYLETGDQAYFDAIAPALEWLKRSTVGKDCWARHYELKTNKPIYGGEDGLIRYRQADARSGYTWQHAFRIPEFIAKYERVKAQGREAILAERLRPQKAEPLQALASKAQSIIQSLDSQNRWLVTEQFRKESFPMQLISTSTYIKNMETLAKYLRQIETNQSDSTPPVPLSRKGK